jgi:hypothetical protein
MRIKKARTLDLHEANEGTKLVFRQGARASFSQKVECFSPNFGDIAGCGAEPLINIIATAIAVNR